MGLVKFKKELTNEQYQNLSTKNEDTLYFITDTGKIYLCETEYGGRNLSVVDTASIGLDNASGLTGEFILSSEAGNSLTADNGLWAPLEGAAPIENPVEGDFIAVTGEGQLKDSEYSLSTEITDDSENEVPTAAAVYAALEELALLWEGEPENIFPGSDSPWKDYTHALTYSDSVTDTGLSYLHSDGSWVRLHIDVICAKPLDSDVELMFVPLHMNAVKDLLFPAFYSTNLDNWEIKGGSSLSISDNAVKAEFPVFTTGSVRIIADLYYVMADKSLPAA
ncbi:MAG: hypothetical protein LBT59_15225 [Clostridiales bacterium]|jgi:hypothetical protein|nr:hypothetical protein [Clostridiales bacterium]